MIAFIFDLNGTVIEDEMIWAEAFQQVLQKQGVVVPAGFIHTPGIGVENNWIKLKTKFNTLGKRSIADLVQETNQIYYHRLNQEGRLRRGFKEFIQQAKKNKIPTALATSINRTVFEKEAERFPILKTVFDVYVTGDEVKNKKPSPEIFLKAAEKLKVNPVDCLVFEDSVKGLQAGIAAHMQVVALPNTLENPSSFARAQLIAHDFADPRVKDLIKK